MGEQPVDFLTGTLEMLVLRVLAGEPMHGYGISQWIRNRTDDELRVQDAAMYQALRRMEAKGWVEADWRVTDLNRRARYYALTDAGREQLRRQTSAWERFAQAVSLVLQPREAA